MEQWLCRCVVRIIKHIWFRGSLNYLELNSKLVWLKLSLNYSELSLAWPISGAKTYLATSIRLLCPLLSSHQCFFFLWQGGAEGEATLGAFGAQQKGFHLHWSCAWGWNFVVGSGWVLHVWYLQHNPPDHHKVRESSGLGGFLYRAVGSQLCLDTGWCWWCYKEGGGGIFLEYINNDDRMMWSDLQMHKNCDSAKHMLHGFFNNLIIIPMQGT